VKVRRYRQDARAASTEATRAAILDAVDEVFLPNPGRPFSLDEVAERAGTTVQTVLRHFATKAGLIEAAARRGLASVQAGRDDVRVGDLDAVVQYLGAHYEEKGAMVLGILAVEHESSEVGRVAQSGRDLHRKWVERVLAPLLDNVDRTQRRRRRAMLIAVTDLLTWKVLRLEQGLNRRDYERCVRELLEGMR
jgi:AcrR family transcriptional regulator